MLDPAVFHARLLPRAFAGSLTGRAARPPDALIVGTGLACQVSHIVTNDQDWKGKLAKMTSRFGAVRTSDDLPSE